MYKFFILLLVSLCTINRAKIEVSQNIDKDLPRIFDVKEESCPHDHKFCKIDVKLTPINGTNPPEIWKTIEQIDNGDRRYYRRDMVYRGICVEKDDLKKEYNEYLNVGLKGSIERSYCIGEVKFTEMMDFVDIILGLTLLCYTIFIHYCTIKTKNSNYNESDELQGEKVNKYIEIFSVSNTWKDIRTPDKSESFKRLRFIQGMRTVTMAVVIACHNYSLMILTFSRNPEYVEKFSVHPLTQILIGSYGFIVQTFFVISSWLLALKLHNILKKNGRITLNDVLILAVNRYFRLIPAVILIIFLYRSSAIEALLPSVYFSHLEAEQKRCTNGWWTNLLFIQNFSVFEGQMCSPPTWFIAVDTQLYILISMLFYLSYKYEIPMKLLLGLTVIVAMCLQVHTVMSTDFDGLLRMSPRNLPIEIFSTTQEVLVSYINTICNVASYAIGFVFGEIYTRNRHKTIFSTNVSKTIWFLAFLGLPVVASLLSLYKFPRGIEALFAVSLRPMFSLGIAIGLLGMSTRTGGILKSCLEWEPFVFLGNFTYSVYMFHFLIIFGKIVFWTNMVELNSLFYVGNLCIDIVLSFALGILMYIVLEHPCGQLQKMILPQIKTAKRNGPSGDT